MPVIWRPYTCGHTAASTRGYMPARNASRIVRYFDFPKGPSRILKARLRFATKRRCQIRRVVRNDDFALWVAA